MENVSEAIVRCLRQCCHFGARKHKMSWTTLTNSSESLLDLY